MKIWVDGDACPKPIKTILFRAAIRTETKLIMVSNHFFEIPTSPFIQRLMVEAGFDVADKRIIQELQAGDLVITADIPLADAAISKQAMALNPRGTLYSSENIKRILAMRNFNETLRDSGMISGGQGKLSQKEIQIFSNHLDKMLTQQQSR